MKISENMQKKLICPTSKTKLKKKGKYFESEDNSAKRYPIVYEIPILIDEKRSLFTVNDYKQKDNKTLNLKKPTKANQILKKFIPTTSVNIKAKENFNKICKILPNNSKILIIGGRIKGQGMDAIYSHKSFDIVGSDVSFGPYTTLICDAHDIPFDDQVFDCVIIQAVLEHVLEPTRCVSEVHRVLKQSGLVYAETPFIQQVHGKQYDFTRFTHLGHRRLFRYFEEISSGPACGPGMALAWSYSFFLRSFATGHLMSRILLSFGYITSFYLKYFDFFLIDKPGSYDAASALFFLGRKSTKAISDRDLINQFKGIK